MFVTSYQFDLLTPLLARNNVVQLSNFAQYHVHFMFEANTGWVRLIRSLSSVSFSFELSGIFELNILFLFKLLRKLQIRIEFELIL